MRRLGIFGAALSLLVLGCFDFDAAYRQRCDGGTCAPDSGVDAGSTGGGSATGGGSGGGNSSGGGSPSGGGGAGAGAGVCLDWSRPCTAEGQCCAVSDAGLPMACGRVGFCQEHAPDCRDDGFSCSEDSQCCTGTCAGGKCKICGLSGASCAKASECCLNEGACEGGACTSSGTNGALCNNSSNCQSKWCHNGVCESPASCGGLSSALIAACCSGLVSDGAKCCLPVGSTCYYSTDCCSSTCSGGRCAEGTPTLGTRCTLSCSGSTALCDPSNDLCVARWCLDPSKNLYQGCCSWTAWNGTCRFEDAGTCLMPTATTTDPTRCCAGTATSNRCDLVYLY